MSRYVTVVRLGPGGMSELSLGVLLGAAGYRRPVVLKRARGADAEELAAARRALVREAHVAAMLNHPNVVHVYELTEGAEGLTLAMEYLPGVSVQGLLAHLEREGGALAWPIAARIVADAARGLAHAHRARAADGRPLDVVHRDVSPKNLVVTEDGITKVVDFGIAHSALREDTAHVMVKGTAGYLSPEQARGDEVDWRSDVFSLGIVLYELASGRNPFVRPRVDQTMSAIVNEAAPQLPDELPAPMRDLAARMVAKHPSHRRLEMSEVADLLETLAIGHGGGHRDVAALLVAELGAQLEGRRARVRDLLAGASIEAPAAALPEHTGTIVLLEHVLDHAVVSISDEHRPLGGADEISDTIADDSYENAETTPRKEERRR